MKGQTFLGAVLGLLAASVLSGALLAPDAAAVPRSSTTTLHGWSTSPVGARQGSALSVRVRVMTGSTTVARVLTVQRRRAGTTRWWTTSRQTTTAGVALVRLSTASAGGWQFRLFVPATAHATAFVTPVRTVLVAAPTVDLRTSELVRLVNGARAHARMCGAQSFPAVRPLAYSAVLSSAARGHATDMATHNYFGHTSPAGTDPTARAVRAGYHGVAGENIAAGFDSPATVMAAWLASPGHCANIMDPGYEDLGIGIAYSAASTYRTYWVEDFGIRA